MSNGKIVPPPALISGSGLKTLGASSDGDEAERVPKNLSTNLSLLRPSVLTILLAASFFPKNEFKTDLRPNNCVPFPRNDLRIAKIAFIILVLFVVVFSFSPPQDNFLVN